MKTDHLDTFGTQGARETTLSKLRLMLSEFGVQKIYVKRLAPNDNSKNQIYLGGDFSSLNIIPAATFETFQSSSRKDSLMPGELLIRAGIKFNWVGPTGQIYPAPNAKLILYPQYPEVRLSGYLQGSTVNASEWMDPHKQGRAEGRFLLIGIHPDGACYAYLSIPGSVTSKELDVAIGDSDALLNEISIGEESVHQSRDRLLSELRRIHLSSPIAGKKFDRASGSSKPYKAPNGGGYTLEAELGIAPNGYSEPDFDGWEVKAYSGNVLTLMTPEPDGGFYQSSGIDAFIRKYGYSDRNGRKDRLNFGGIHRVGKRCKLTGLTMALVGFQPSTKGMLADGRICLVDDRYGVAAEWSFTKLLEHWKRKHARAAYVPYKKVDLDGATGYSYAHKVCLGEGTDFLHLLNAFANQEVYYDPGIKLIDASADASKAKRRSQFRIRSLALQSLYSNWHNVELLK